MFCFAGAKVWAISFLGNTHKMLFFGEQRKGVSNDYLVQQKNNACPYLEHALYIMYQMCSVGLDTQLLADICRDGILVDYDVHGLVSHVGLAHVPESLVWSIVAP